MMRINENHLTRRTEPVCDGVLSYTSWTFMAASGQLYVSRVKES